MQSDNDSYGNELIQLGETILNQAFDDNNDQNENNSDSSKNNLYVHTVQLSNFFKTLNSDDSMKESDVQQILQLISKIFSDLNSIKKIPSSEVGPQSPVNESYKILAYSLYLLLKDQNNDFLKHPNENETKSNANENISSNTLENSSELLSFLAEEYDLPRNLSQKEIITTIREYKRNENSLSPKKEVDGEIKSLKIKIERLQNSQQESDATLKEKIDALAKINAVQKKEISKLQKQNQTLQSQVNMAIAEALNINKSPLPDKSDDIDSARLTFLENDIKSIKNEYDRLKNKKKKISAENQQLQSENQRLIENGKQKDKQIIELKQSLVQLQIEIEQLTANNEINNFSSSNDAEIKLKEGENKKLSSALNEISNHLKSLSSEISIESNRSNILYELAQKLLIVTNKYDILLNEKEKEVEKSQSLIKESQSAIIDLKEKQVMLEKNKEKIKESEQTIEEIKHYLSSKDLPDQLNSELFQIIDIESPTSSRIINIIDLILNKYINKISVSDINANLEQQNDRLINFCSSLLQFFEQLANSSEMQQWIIGSPQDESFRPLLLSQCNKIEAFIKQYSAEINLNYEDFFNFPSRIEKIIDDEIQPQSCEVVLLFQLCSTVNDALRRYAINLNEANHALINDIHELRHEIQQVSNECVFTFDEIKKSKNTSSSLQISGPKSFSNSKIDEIIRIIEESRQNSNCSFDNENETIEKIMKILDSKSSNSQIQVLAKENEKLKDEIIQIKQQNDENERSIKLTLKENDELKKKERKNQSQLNQLQEIINDQKEQIKESRDNYDLIQNANTDQISKLNEEIQNWKQKFSTLENEKISQKSSLKNQFSKNVQKLQKENKELTLQIENLRNHYESLIENARNKLKESLETESKLTNELKKLNLNLKQTSSDLSTTKVENKMLKLKITASDEKMQREKNLLETHFKMNKLNLETKHETEMESLKGELEKQFHEFLVSICERFKDFFDFNQPISESSVQSLLIRIGNELRKEKERLSIFELYSNEMNTVRSILGLNDSEPVIPIITEIVKKLNKVNNKMKIMSAEKIENLNEDLFNDQTANEWEKWAKKLILMVSDGFISVKSSKQLQSAIEEAIMVGISQRSLIKKIGILRSEKILLQNGKIYIKGRHRRLSLNSILLVLACIRRLQINAGHLPSTISKYNKNNENLAPQVNDNENENKNKSQIDQKIDKRNYPIISPL